MQPRLWDAKSVGLTGKVHDNQLLKQTSGFTRHVGIGKWGLLVTGYVMLVCFPQSP